MLLIKSVHIKQLPTLIITLIVASTLTACGGGGGGSNDTTATGTFKDSNTAGLSYSSGAQVGVTDSDGNFTYEVGEKVTFAIGGVTLGTTDGKPVVTPVDLVAGGSSASLEVQNIVRFLLMLDDDGDPTNGINISSAVQEIAKLWPQVDFAAADLSVELTSIISDAASVDVGVIHTLPDASTAQAHMEETLGCIYAGGYTGTFSGDDSGSIAILVEPDGYVEGVAHSALHDEYTELESATISYGNNVTFKSDFDEFEDPYFEGSFTSVNTVEGTWGDPVEDGKGTFSVSRIGGKADAQYRFTGLYYSDDEEENGVFTFDIDSSNNVAGVAYSVTDNKIYTIDGSVSGNSVSADSSDGSTISGTLDKGTGELWGTWSDGDLSGEFDGSGCSLN
jgi:hypothetical protein